jgi:D-alanyl-lipoteichoic acid acyltransferase DltB (MBOAT superfamily)
VLRWIPLLIGSVIIYAYWKVIYLPLIVVAIAASYLAAIGLERSQNPRVRAVTLAAAIGVLLSLLFFFKYTNFALRNLEAAMHAAGLRIDLPVLDVLLPVGISFYTFQALGYVVDVFRRDIPA